MCDRASRLVGANFSNANLQSAIISGNVSAGQLNGAKVSLSSWVGAQFENSNDVKAAEGWETAFYSDRDLRALGLPADHNVKLARILRDRFPTFRPEARLLISALFDSLRKSASSVESLREELSLPLPSPDAGVK